MVRGRLYIPGDGTRVWRSSSVPADDLRPPLDVNVLHKAHMIKTHAVNDADAIKAASKRHDIDFLNDISNKLAVATQPRPYYRESTPAYPRYPAPQPIPADYRRRTWYAPPVSDYEITNYLAGGPQPYHRRNYRGASVPPATNPVAYRYVPSPAPSVRSSSVSRAPVYSVTYAPKYGDVVVGVPYNKYQQPTSNGLSHSLYRPSRYSYAPAVNGKGSLPPNYRRASLASVPAYKSLYDDVDEILSTPRHKIVTSNRYHDADLDVEWPTVRPLTTLKGRAQSVQRQLDGIPEFQVYTPSRPRAASTVPTYSAPTPASAYSTPYVSSGSSLLPSTGSTSAPKAPRTSGRPPVSEARRKVRSLLCKSKNDPHYYDGY